MRVICSSDIFFKYISKSFFPIFMKSILVILLQHQYFYSIKLFLMFLYSRQHSQSLYLIPVCFIFLSCPYLHLILSILSAKESCINLALSKICNLKDMVFGISSPFSLILVTLFSIVSEKVKYFSQFSPKQSKLSELHS